MRASYHGAVGAGLGAGSHALDGLGGQMNVSVRLVRVTPARAIAPAMAQAAQMATTAPLPTPLSSGGFQNGGGHAGGQAQQGRLRGHGNVVKLTVEVVEASHSDQVRVSISKTKPLTP